MDILELDLQDCPICGGPAILEEENGWCYYVACLDCSAHTADVAFHSPDEREPAMRSAARLWNIGTVVSSDPGE